MEKSNYHNDITIAVVLYKEDFNLINKTLSKLRSFKTIIVDNHNDLDLKKKIESNFSIDNYILNSKNLGFSAGYNQAAKLCKTKYLLILGPDCIISDQDVCKLADYLSIDINCFLVSATSYNENMTLMTYTGGPLPENGGREKILNLSGNTCVESILGACMMVRIVDFKKIGMFDENFFIYFSDDDLCRRVKKLNKTVIQVYDSKSIHQHGEIKVKNKYLKKFIRENNYIFDNLYYFYKIDKNHVSIKSFQKKIIPYLFKFILKILTFNFLGAVEIFSKVLGYLRFIYKIKWRDGRVV